MDRMNTIFGNNNHDRIILGAQMLSPRFSFLDHQRMASMSDEGGSAAAILDSQETLEIKILNSCKPQPEVQAEEDGNRIYNNPAFVLSATAVGVGLSYYWMRSFWSLDPS